MNFNVNKTRKPPSPKQIKQRKLAWKLARLQGMIYSLASMKHSEYRRTSGLMGGAIGLLSIAVDEVRKDLKNIK